MIRVRLLSLLVAKSRRGLASYDVPAAPDITVRDLVADAGLDERSVQLVLVNGRPGFFVTRLADGDEVLMGTALAGG